MKENNQKLRAATMDIFDNLKDIYLFTLNYHMLDGVVEEKSGFELCNYLEVSS